MRCDVQLHTKLQLHRAVPELANLYGPDLWAQVAPLPVRWGARCPAVPTVYDPEHVAQTAAEECYSGSRYHYERRTHIYRDVDLSQEA